MRVAICDDLFRDRNQLGEYVHDYLTDQRLTVQIDEYESGEELLSAFRPHTWQIVFLDIYMGGLSGVDTAREIRKTDADCCIIFTTTSRDHAMDGYEVRASDYLVKPYARSDAEEALAWCLSVLASTLKSVEVLTDRDRRQLPLKDIYYIEVSGHSCQLHTADGVLPTNQSLTDLEAAIDDDNFLRCHRSFLVNMNMIRRPDQADFLMKNGDRVPISTDNLSRIRQDFFNWTFRRTWEGQG